MMRISLLEGLQSLLQTLCGFSIFHAATCGPLDTFSKQLGTPRQLIGQCLHTLSDVIKIRQLSQLSQHQICKKYHLG